MKWLTTNNSIPIRILLILAISASIQAIGQVDRSKAPAPAPMRDLKIGEYESFTLKNGLQVFVVENHKLPRVQFSIQLKHGPIWEGEKVGYISIAGNLIGTGTTSRSKAQLDEEVDFIGASLSTSASSVYASSLTKHSDKLLELMTDVLFNPSFDEGELEKLKTQSISGITAGQDDPNTIASNVRGILLYGKDHPYGEVATVESVKSVTLEDCKSYYQKYFKPNNAYFVIVGDVTIKQTKSIANKNFSKWTSGEVEQLDYTNPTAPEKTFVALIDRPSSVQSIINVTYPVNLEIGSPDVIKARVMNYILGGNFSSRLNQNLREKHAYTYGAGSSLRSDELIGSFDANASVRNEVTDSAVHEIMYELRRMADESVSESELAAAKASIAGAFGRSLEQPQTIASFAVNTAKYNLPKDHYSTLLKRLDAVTVEDVSAIAKKYIKPNQAYIEVVGKGSEIAESLKRFGEVKYYDINGNNYEPATLSAIPSGLTAARVIDKYLGAVGGEKLARSLRTIKTTYKATAMGTEITMTILKASPQKSNLEIAANGMVFQQVISNGEKVSMSAMGQKMPVDQVTRDKTIFESAIFPELYLEDVEAKLAGVELVDGKEAYVIEYKLQSGGVSTFYYDAQSGLKVQQVETVEGPQGTMSATTTYTEYKPVNGVLIPQVINQNQGPMNFKFEIIEIKLNPNLPESSFLIE
ncbi:MAG: insulinase family protein [Cyclobacteriaceae bacterium]